MARRKATFELPKVGWWYRIRDPRTRASQTEVWGEPFVVIEVNRQRGFARIAPHGGLRTSKVALTSWKGVACGAAYGTAIRARDSSRMCFVGEVNARKWGLPIPAVRDPEWWPSLSLDRIETATRRAQARRA